MRMLVVGAGSTGGYFGGRLAAAGRDVTFLVRPSRAAQLKANGLQIVSPWGDLTVAPQLATTETLNGAYDAVLLTVKAFSLENAMEDFAPAVGKNTMILPFLNGMKHVDRLTARFGKEAFAGCVCKVATSLDDQGRIIQMAKFQDVAYGEMDGRTSERMTKLDAFMTGAGFNARLSPKIVQEMWEKWILLASMGAITCLMRGSIGDIEAVPGGRAFEEAVLAEVIAIVAGLGYPPDEDFVAYGKEMLTTKGSPQASSMYRDLQKGAAIEADQIIGDLIDRARRAGLPAPLLTLAYTHLAVYQSRRTAA